MKYAPSLIILTLTLFLGAADAQTDASITSASSTTGSTTTVTTRITSTQDIYGWSWGVCHDGAVAEAINVQMGAATMALNAGSGPDFYSPFLFSGEGWSVGVVVSFLFDDVLAPGVDQEMDVASYVLLDQGTTLVCFCDTLQPGADPVSTLVVVNEDGTAEVPNQTCGSLTSGGRFTFAVPDSIVSYDPGTGAASFTVSPTIADEPTAPGFPANTSGFSMAISHDEDLIVVTDVSEAQLLLDLDGGMGPDFFAPALLPTGFTLGVVYDFFGVELLPFAVPTEVIEVSYATVPSGLMGDLDGETTSLDFDDSLGDPPAPNIVVIEGGDFFSPLFSSGAVEFVPGTADIFVRGDFDGNGTISLPDAVGILNFLFVPGSPAPSCQDAADVDDSGSPGLPDGIGLLNFQFVPGSPPPAPPHPDCGVDPTPDGLDCAQFDACP